MSSWSFCEMPQLCQCKTIENGFLLLYCSENIKIFGNGISRIAKFSYKRLALKTHEKTYVCWFIYQLLAEKGLFIFLRVKKVCQKLSIMNEFVMKLYPSVANDHLEYMNNFTGSYCPASFSSSVHHVYHSYFSLHCSVCS